MQSFINVSIHYILIMKVKIMFFSWDSFYSNAIQFVTGSKWTHIGVAFLNENGDYTVFEAVNKGLVQSTYSKDFINQKVKEGVICVKEVRVSESRDSVEAICEKYEGAPYDWLSIFNIGFSWLFGKVALNFAGPRAVICSEFVARVLYEASHGKIDFQKEFKKPFDHVTPADIFKSKQMR